MISDSLEAAGAVHLQFNPLTARVCTKELKRIAAAEHAAVPDSVLSSIVESSHCDLFNAIQALRMHLLGAVVARAGIGQSRKAPKGKTEGKGSGGSERLARDAGLDLFHALGKILYNKRYDATGALVRAPARCTALHVPAKLPSHRGRGQVLVATL